QTDDSRPQIGQLATRNSSGRTGAFFLPPGFRKQPLPLLVLYHGTGGSGRDMVGAFADFGISRRFFIVAPDSRRFPKGELTWQVPGQPGEQTEDESHTFA